VNVLEQLVETESARTRLANLVAIANILNYELQSRSRPSSSMTKRSTRTRTTAAAFERIERILRQPARLARAGACLPAHDQAAGALLRPADKRAYLLALWRGLAEISRVRQADLAAAAAALEVCVSCSGGQQTARGAGRGVRSAGSWRVCRSSQAAEQLLAAASDAEGAAQQIRALAGLLRRAPALRRSFLCLCRALRTDEGQCPGGRHSTRNTALAGVPLAKAQVSEGLWQGWVCTPRQDRRISQVLAAVSGGVTISRPRMRKPGGSTSAIGSI